MTDEAVPRDVKIGGSETLRMSSQSTLTNAKQQKQIAALEMQGFKVTGIVKTGAGYVFMMKRAQYFFRS